jgi:hypothetical protein
MLLLLLLLLLLYYLRDYYIETTPKIVNDADITDQCRDPINFEINNLENLVKKESFCVVVFDNFLNDKQLRPLEISGFNLKIYF